VGSFGVILDSCSSVCRLSLSRERVAVTYTVPPVVGTVAIFPMSVELDTCTFSEELDTFLSTDIMVHPPVEEIHLF
jgi:hypothetical protein